MTHTNNPRFSIVSIFGKAAKNMATEAVYLTAKSPDEFDPLTFIRDKLQKLHTTTDGKREVYQRFWLYYGVLLVALQDGFYLSLQSELVAAYELYCSTMEPDLDDGFVFQNRFYPIPINGSLQEFYFQSGCGSQFLDSLHDYLDSVKGDGMYSIKILEMLSTSVTARIAVKPRESNTAPKHSYVSFLRNDMNSEYNPE